MSKSKYNSQKYSSGRLKNRQRQIDSLSHKNLIYNLIDDENYNISIDSEFNFDIIEDIKFKNIYANIKGFQIVICKITEIIKIDCDFMKNIKLLYDICKNNKILIVENTINTLICPSSYNAESFDNFSIIEGLEGYYREVSSYRFFNFTYDNKTYISGHSESLSVSETEGIDLNLISEMTHFDFFIYFSSLNYF